MPSWPRQRKLWRAALLSFVLLAVAMAQGGRGGIPNATSQQAAAVSQLNAELATPTQALAAARTELISVSLAEPRNDAAIEAKVEAVKAADLTLATARADVRSAAF